MDLCQVRNKRLLLYTSANLVNIHSTLHLLYLPSPCPLSKSRLPAGVSVWAHTPTNPYHSVKIATCYTLKFLFALLYLLFWFPLARCCFLIFTFASYKTFAWGGGYFIDLQTSGLFICLFRRLIRIASFRPVIHLCKQPGEEKNGRICRAGSDWGLWNN